MAVDVTALPREAAPPGAASSRRAGMLVRRERVPRLRRTAWSADGRGFDPRVPGTDRRRARHAHRRRSDRRRGSTPRTQVVHVDLPLAVIDRFAEPQVARDRSSDLSCRASRAGRCATSSRRADQRLSHPVDFAAGKFRQRPFPGRIARRYRYRPRDERPPRPRPGASRRGRWGRHSIYPCNAVRRNAADSLVGEHDFAAFARRPGRTGRGPSASLPRRVTSAEWCVVAGDHLRFEIEAKAFAHQMVRSIVGVLVAVGLGRRRADDVAGILARADRSGLPTIAPPGGLTLIARQLPPSPWRSVAE